MVIATSARMCRNATLAHKTGQALATRMMGTAITMAAAARTLLNATSEAWEGPSHTPAAVRLASVTVRDYQEGIVDWLKPRQSSGRHDGVPFSKLRPRLQ
jgi:hypothetical protein